MASRVNPTRMELLRLKKRSAAEIEVRSDGDLSGIAVHIAARILEHARPGEILSSRTVNDLVAGWDVPMEDRGTHDLKGVAGRWQLFAVAPS
jgi:class 3 adenylate cyclase